MKILKTLLASFFIFTGILYADDLYSLEIPICKATSSHENGDDHEVHTYNGFQFCYREEYEVAEWVSYTLTKDKLKGSEKRKNNFREDFNITTGSSTPQDYRGSGFDRGHLIPAADCRWDEEAMSDSFLMSNMTPQKPEFNRGIWAELEKTVRDYVLRYESVTVITGPILEKKPEEYMTIGENGVCVPEFFYKVLLAKKQNGRYTCVGFILPNSKGEKKLVDYIVPVDEIEERCNLDFFSSLDDNIENVIESELNIEDWK